MGPRMSRDDRCQVAFGNKGSRPWDFGKDLMVPRIIRNVGEGDRSLRVDVLINVGFGGGRSQQDGG